MSALTEGYREAWDESRKAGTVVFGAADAAAMCAGIDSYLGAETTISACYQMLPEPADLTLIDARQWLRTSGEKRIEALTFIGYYCSGLEEWDSVSPILREAGAAGDKANGLLDSYFMQHPEDKPHDWVY